MIDDRRSAQQSQEGLHGDEEGLPAATLGRLRLSRQNLPQATWPDSAIHLDSSGQGGLGPPLSDGTGTMGNVEFEGRRPPPDREPAGVRTGQRLLEGVALPRQFAVGEAQSPPLPPPPTPPQQQQQKPAWQSTDFGLAMLAGIAAGDVEAASTTAAATSRHTDAGTARSEVVGCGGVPSIDELLAPSPVGVIGRYTRQHSTPFRAAPPPVATASGGGEVNPSDDAQPACGAATPSPTIVANGSFGTGSPLPVLGALDPHRGSHTGSLPTAKAPFEMTTGASSPIARYFEAGELGSVEGGLSPLGVGGNRWQWGGGRSGGAGSGAGPLYSRLYHDDRLLHLSPLRDPYSPHSTKPQDFRGRDRHPQLRPILPPGETSITPPWLRRRSSDPGPHSTAMRPLPSSLEEDNARSSYSLPGLAEVDAIMGHLEAGRSLRSNSIGELRAKSARRHVGGDDWASVGAGSGDGATTEGERREHRRFNFPEPTNLPTTNERVDDGYKRLPYGHEGSEKRTYVGKRRVVGGKIDTRHPMCRDTHCTRQPSFGMEGDRRASYCARHKKAGMINVASRRCQQAGCIRHPNFGFPGDKRSTYCKQHSEMGMVDIVSRRCQDPSCMRRPLYNYIGLRSMFCSKHKLPGMIDVVSARCEEPGCSLHPSLGYPSDKKARRCAAHRLYGMENVKKGPPRQKRRREVTTSAAMSSTASPHGAPSSTAFPSSPCGHTRCHCLGYRCREALGLPNQL